MQNNNQILNGLIIVKMINYLKETVQIYQEEEYVDHTSKDIQFRTLSQSGSCFLIRIRKYFSIRKQIMFQNFLIKKWLHNWETKFKKTWDTNLLINGIFSIWINHKKQLSLLNFFQNSNKSFFDNLFWNHHIMISEEH